MPSNFTKNYRLNQWGATDRVIHEDFNADNAKIDAALKAEADARTALEGKVDRELVGQLRCAVGSYTGDGTASRTIQVDFRPKVMFIRCLDKKQTFDIFGSIGVYQGETRYQCTNDDYFTLAITSSKVTLSCGYSWDDWEKATLVCNSSGRKYIYTVLG